MVIRENPRRFQFNEFFYQYCFVGYTNSSCRCWFAEFKNRVNSIGLARVKQSLYFFNTCQARLSNFFIDGLAGIYPARKMGKMLTAEALRYE